MERRRVVRVSKTEFELDNGAVYPHPSPLDRIPSAEEFQKTYDCWFQLFQDKGWINEEPPIEKGEPVAQTAIPKAKGKRLKATR